MVFHKSSQLPLYSTVHYRKLQNRITRSVSMKEDHMLHEVKLIK